MVGIHEFIHLHIHPLAWEKSAIWIPLQKAERDFSWFLNLKDSSWIVSQVGMIQKYHIFSNPCIYVNIYI